MAEPEAARAGDLAANGGPRAAAGLVDAHRPPARDLMRREAARDGKAEAVSAIDALDGAVPEPDDDLLRLVFTCCHLSLAPETQVAPALRTLCGLSTAEVARALLVPEASMTKRLVRARQKIARAAIPYRLPADLQDSRRDARHDGAGRPVLLADQDRGRWRHDLVEEGVVLVGQSLRRSPHLHRRREALDGSF